jgi:centromeric protein E
LNAKRRIESQDTQILSLEAALTSRPSMPVLPADPLEDDKDRLIAELQKANKELNIVVQAYEANLNLEEPLTAVKEDVEKEWKGKVEQLEKELEDSKQWVQQLVKELEREKQVQALSLSFFFARLSILEVLTLIPFPPVVLAKEQITRRERCTRILRHGHRLVYARAAIVPLYFFIASTFSYTDITNFKFYTEVVTW